MVTVKIGPTEKELTDADENWINQEINQLRKDKQAVCVRVRIQTDSLNLVLATPACTGGGGRPPRPNEQKLFDLWKKRGLNEPNFTGGNIVAFLKQLRNFL